MVIFFCLRPEEVVLGHCIIHYLCPPQNYNRQPEKAQPLFWISISHDKFILSHKLNICIEKKLTCSNSIDLVFYSLKNQKRLTETNLPEKKRLTNLQKLKLPKKSFLRCIFLGTTCFDKSFSFHVMTGKYSFFIKFIVTLKFFSTAVSSLSLKQVVWKLFIYNFIIFLSLEQQNNSNIKILKWSSLISWSSHFIIKFS